MATLTTISINDGATTPVAHSFAPLAQGNGSAEWAERLTTGAAFWPLLKNDVIRPSLKALQDDSKPFVIRWNIKVPVTVTANGVTTEDHFSSASVNFYFSPKASEQEKKDLVAYVTNLLSTTAVKNAAIAIEPFF